MRKRLPNFSPRSHMTLHPWTWNCFQEREQKADIQADISVWHCKKMCQINLLSVKLWDKTSIYATSTLPSSQAAPVQPVKQWQRKSPFLSSQRTVPMALQGEGEHWSGISDRGNRKGDVLLPSSRSKIQIINHHNCRYVPFFLIVEGHLFCLPYLHFSINSLKLG